MVGAHSIFDRAQAPAIKCRVKLNPAMFYIYIHSHHRTLIIHHPPLTMKSSHISEKTRAKIEQHIAGSDLAAANQKTGAAKTRAQQKAGKRLAAANAKLKKK